MTLDELRKKAEDVRNLATTEVRETVNDVAENKLTTAALIGVGVVVLLASAAYFAGSRSGRGQAQREFDRIVKDPCGPFGPFGKDLERG